MYTDSHSHLDRLDLTPYNDHFDDFLSATRGAGVERMLCVAIDMDHYPAMMDLVRGRAEILTSVGVHPNEKSTQTPLPETLAEMALAEPQNVAIGETGLDYFHGEGDLSWQRERFRLQIRAARLCNKPLIIHTRQARKDTLSIMREEGADGVGGVMHCFTEDWETASQALDMGFYISFSGILTFKNADDLRAVARQVPDERLLIETDAPYLAPVPHRGKPNEPRHVIRVAECLADLRETTPEAIGVLTTENFNRLFLPKT